jgi:hypothetical protein
VSSPRHFHCEGTHGRQSVSACGTRFDANLDPICKGCPVGAEHASGKLPTHWPPERGGGPIVRLTLKPHDWIPSRVKKRRAST